ncbi:MAG: phosphohistidine phosphatase SixA [Bryobacteraceae bacterium]|nr:phosphohistidine phosphatase SixA [Bryobacteraceae bacterium]MDW8377980.1 phosphohistidine phosphatase SixA [Bryobacterales bacterium]
MELYLLRHGLAEEAKPGSRDADRALTAEGKRKLRLVLGVARRAGLRPDLILTSPYRRAVETAQIAAELLEYNEPLLETPQLVPEADAAEAWAEIRIHKAAKSILVSSHEPLTSELIHFLCGARAEVKKGSLTRIDLEHVNPRPSGVLKWMLTPKLAEGFKSSSSKPPK